MILIKKKYILLCFVNLSFLILLMITFNVKDKDLVINVNKSFDNKIEYNDVVHNLRDKYNNKDIVGLLKVSNTDFEVPIVQTIDNSYYLNHDLNNKDNVVGSIFLDYRVDIDNSHKLLIYGHSSSDIKAPFNILERYYDEDYYKKHRYIELITSTKKYLYELFSVYIEVDDFSYMCVDFINSKDFLMHIKKLGEKSIYNNKFQLKDSDKILILQTCSHHENYVNYEKKYLLIISRRIE